MIDLHVHTTHSDGRLTPIEVVQEAVARGIRHLAITDHDVLTGLPEAGAAAEDTGVEIIPGIEMTTAGGDAGTGIAVHVLGLFLDPADAALNRALLQARVLMGRHVDAVLAAIRATGASLELAHLDRYRHRYAGGAALVLAMIDRGVLRQAPPGTGMRLLRLAAREPRAYVLADAVSLIHGAGGVAVLAHPWKIKRRQPLLSAAELEPFAAASLDAIEAGEWPGNGRDSNHYQLVAAELGLLTSGGSDDHGKRDAAGATRLGRQSVPSGALEALRARAAGWQARRLTPVPPPG